MIKEKPKSKSLYQLILHLRLTANEENKISQGNNKLDD